MGTGSNMHYWEFLPSVINIMLAADIVLLAYGLVHTIDNLKKL